jgi:hypothetical protein
MSNILVKDDSNPLVELTLIGIKGDRPKWRAQVVGVPIDAQVTFEFLANEKLPDGNYRRVVKLEVPVLETLGTAGTSAGYVAQQKVAYRTPVTVSLVQNQRADAAAIANAMKIALGMLQGASSTTATGTINQASAADAYKNSTAIVPRFMVYGEEPV